jgi:hypothetical protein
MVVILLIDIFLSFRPKKNLRVLRGKLRGGGPKRETTILKKIQKEIYI